MIQKTKYFLRIDDVCPTMNRASFKKIQEACDKFNIKPIVGIVPDNQDQNLQVESENKDFWKIMKNLADNNWIIAQHGYQHIYNARKTEFTGLPYQEQFDKLQKGQSIMKEKLGFTPTWFMAPAHSIDTLTSKALVSLSFTHVTDGIAMYPFMKDGLTWVPQQLWRPRSMPWGLWTICLHPNTMTSQDIYVLIEFMKHHAGQFQNISLQPRTSIANIPFQIMWHAIKKTSSLWHT